MRSNAPDNNLTYLVEAPLTADVEGPAIEMGAEGRLTMFIQVPSVSGSPNGLISLQGSLDGSKWLDSPSCPQTRPQRCLRWTLFACGAA
jgi:hypothetical protein